MRKNLTYVSMLVVAIIVVPMVTFAWTAAPENPPSSNISTPINSGATAQAKNAGLLLSTGSGNVNGLIVQYGKVGIGSVAPSYKLQVGEPADGSSVGANAYYYTSDANLKKNVTTLSNSLVKVLKLRGVSFQWKNTASGTGKNVGVIAQEVEKVFPEVVTTDARGVKSVQYANLVGPLIEAIKTQQNMIEALKTRVNALEIKAGIKKK